MWGDDARGGGAVSCTRRSINTPWGDGTQQLPRGATRGSGTCTSAVVTMATRDGQEGRRWRRAEKRIISGRHNVDHRRRHTCGKRQLGARLCTSWPHSESDEWESSKQAGAHIVRGTIRLVKGATVEAAPAERRRRERQRVRSSRDHDCCVLPAACGRERLRERERASATLCSARHVPRAAVLAFPGEKRPECSGVRVRARNRALGDRSNFSCVGESGLPFVYVL